jgi:ABC-type multidrug transport system fused ATPase/permease subunit
MRGTPVCPACHDQPEDSRPRRLVLLRPHRGRVALAAIALVVAALAMLGVGQGLRAVIDRGFSAGDPAWLDRALMMMFGIIALLAAATYTRFYNVSWLGERVTADLRRRVFDHLLTLPPSYFEAGRTGAVISRLTSDTTLIENAVGSSLSIALRNLLILIGGLVMLFTTNLKLTLLVLAACRWWWRPSCCSAAACGASRASARTASPTWATASTRPSTRSASSRPMATRRPTGASSPA